MHLLRLAYAKATAGKRVSVVMRTMCHKRSGVTWRGGQGQTSGWSLPAEAPGAS